MKQLTIAFALLLALPSFAMEPDPLQPIRFLVGQWDSVGQGKPGEATGVATFAPSLQGRVITRTSFAQYPGSRHDDLMIIYAEGAAIRADYYDSEGHVIRYTVKAEPNRAVFTSDAVPGQPRFRLTYVLASPGKLDGSFDIAPPDAPEKFGSYLTWTSKLHAGSAR
jgi:hypothetical protein